MKRKPNPFTGQPGLPSVAWVRFDLGRGQHDQLCRMARAKGSLGELLYDVVVRTFPTSGLPPVGQRHVQWRTDQYIGALFVRVFLTADELNRLNAIAYGRQRSVNDLCMDVLLSTVLRVTPRQEQLTFNEDAAKTEAWTDRRACPGEQSDLETIEDP